MIFKTFTPNAENDIQQIIKKMYKTNVRRIPPADCGHVGCGQIKRDQRARNVGDTRNIERQIAQAFWVTGSFPR